MKSFELRQVAAEKTASVRKLVDLVETENRDMTEEEAAQVGALKKEFTSLQTRAEALETVEEAEKALAQVKPRATGMSAPSVPATAIDHEEDARHGWRNLGEFAAAVQACRTGLGTDNRLLYQSAVTGMGAGIPSDGGFLMPPAFSTEIWDMVRTAPNSLLSMTDNYTVTGESLSFPCNAETSRANSSRYGGIAGYWLDEGGQLTASKPTFRQIKVEPHQLAVMVYVTDKLLRNSTTALAQYITRAATDEILFKTGDAIVNGTGAGQPLGILNSSAVVSVAKQSQQAACTFTQYNVATMWSALVAASWPNAVWLMNQNVYPQLLLMVSEVTNKAGTENVGGFNAKLYDPATNTLMGRPIVVCEYCATVGSVGDVILADMRGYVTGTRGGIETAVSPHLRFDYLESVFRIVYEVDGQPWCQTTFSPYKGTANSLAYFVTCAVRG